MAQVARRYAMNANLIFKWLKDPRYGPEDVVCEAPVFLPDEISPETSVGTPLSNAGGIGSCGGGFGRLEIILSGGVCLKVEGGFDGVELARLVKGLID